MAGSVPCLSLHKRISVGYAIIAHCSQTGGVSSLVTITKETISGDILDIAPQTAPLFMAIGMHCLGCPASRGETVEEACMVHGIDPEELLEELNKQIAAGDVQ